MALLNDKEIGKRLKIIREQRYKDVSSRKFALKAKVDPSQYSKIERGDLPITDNIMDKLVEVYRLNKEFILHGYGTGVPRESGVQDQPESYIKTRRDLKNNKPKKGIPFYDAPASATIQETDMTPIHAPSGTIDVGDLLHDSEAAIRVYGNSMNPNYPPGCVVGLVRCESLSIEPGEVYVIETKTRRILKRLFYPNDKSDSDKITCYSDNIMKFEGGARDGRLAYPPYDLPKKEILNLYVVTGVIKRNANSVIINR